jgi:hypothetical protein
MAAAGASLAAGSAACFSPKFEECAVFCGEAGECPEDQFCLSDGRCHQSEEDQLCTTSGGTDGSVLGDASVPGDDGGGRPDGGDADAGTPDASDIDAGPPINPTQPGDLIITEIHKNPNAVGDDVGEWFEIHNPTTSTFDLNQLEVRDVGDGKVTDLFGIPGVIMAPGDYIVLARNGDPKVNGGVDVTVNYSAQIFVLGNDDDEIIIYNPEAGDVVIDEVRYDIVAFPDPDGATMSLDPALFDAEDNDSGLSWCEGQNAFGDGDLGSPGAPNPPCL